MTLRPPPVERRTEIDIELKSSGSRYDDVIIEKGRKGPQTILTSEEEESLVVWLESRMRRGFPGPDQSLLEEVQKIVKADGRPNPFKDDKPENKWLQLFFKRHPSLTHCTPEALSKHRDISEASLKKWFSEVYNYLKEEELLWLLDCPERILNRDETGFSLCPKSSRVTCPILFHLWTTEINYIVLILVLRHANNGPDNLKFVVIKYLILF